MSTIKSRIPFTAQNPYRSYRPKTEKIIFLSCEGSVTEEEYFYIVSTVFDRIKSKIQFVSVVEDAIKTEQKFRTTEQKNLLTKNRPRQLFEKIEQFKAEKEYIYNFSKHDDEFWIVTDVDNNTLPEFIDDWLYTLNKCDEKNYGYAISNPFFEMWLLLHHADPTDADKSYAITDAHTYGPTNHFRERLRKDACAPLKKKKHISDLHYSEENIKQAVERAKLLHTDKSCKWPKYYATTVYVLIEKILDLLHE